MTGLQDLFLHDPDLILLNYGWFGADFYAGNCHKWHWLH